MKLYRRQLKSGPSPHYYVRLRLSGREIRVSTGRRTYAEAKAWVQRHIQPLKDEKTLAALEKAAQVALAGEALPLLDERGLDLPVRNAKHSAKRRAFRSTPGYTPRKEVERPSAWTCFEQAHPRLSVKERRAYLCSLRGFAAWLAKARVEERLSQKRKKIAGQDLAAVTAKDAQDWLRSLAAAKLATVTLRKHRVRLIRIFDAALELAGLRRNPFRESTAPAADGASRRAFTPEELQRILAESAKEDIGPLVLIGANTGLRLGDAVTLRWDEIDASRDCIRRITSKTKSEVEIPILPALAEWLSGRERSGEFLLPELAELYRKSPGQLSRRFAELLDRLGIRRQESIAGRGRSVTVKSFHALRHTFVYMAAEAQVPLPIIVSIVGHASPRMTEHYAAHATLEAKKRLLTELSFHSVLSGIW
ncbi:MAG: hypothetical protein RL095_1740 [Verrucomicrobiota bacterium]|jgi:integrase